MKNFRRLIALLLCLGTIAAMPLWASATEPTDETRGPEKAKPGIYDFVLEEQYVWIDRDRFSGKSLHSVHVQRAMQDYYDDGTLNWLYAADNIDFMQSESVQAGAASAFGSTPDYKWRGLRLGAITRYNGEKDYPSGYWYAFTFRAPEPGTYDVKLDYMVRNDGTTQGEVYYLDSKYTDSILINRELDQTTLLATVNFNQKTEDGKTYEPASCQLGKIEVTEEEFTLVFHAAEKASGSSCCYMVLSGITLTPAQEDTAPQQDAPNLRSNNDVKLYVLIGGAAVLIVAVVVIVASKKKKKEK